MSNWNEILNSGSDRKILGAFSEAGEMPGETPELEKFVFLIFEKLSNITIIRNDLEKAMSIVAGVYDGDDGDGGVVARVMILDGMSEGVIAYVQFWSSIIADSLCMLSRLDKDVSFLNRTNYKGSRIGFSDILSRYCHLRVEDIIVSIGNISRALACDCSGEKLKDVAIDSIVRIIAISSWAIYDIGCDWKRRLSIEMQRRDAERIKI